MEWVRKNLGFVIGLAVAVVLLGVGLWYTLGTMEESSMADGELQAKRQQLDDLVKRDPFPEQANIDLAREEEEKVTAFIRDARKKFAIRELPDSLDNASFKSLLESTLADLAREAELAGVKLPDKASFSSYSFTLEDQRKQLQLPSSSLVPLAAHLENLAVISRVLFDAKVHSLVSLKRSSVGTNELAGSGDFLSKKVVTNTALNTVVYPYEVVFQGFSPELAKVITGLVNAPQAFVIKTLNVERGSLDSMPAQPAFGAPMAIPGLPPGMDPALARRYGMFGPRPQQMPVAAQQPVTTGRPGEVVLEEKPLQVKLGLEIISLLPAKEPPGPRGRPGPTEPAPADANQ